MAATPLPLVGSLRKGQKWMRNTGFSGGRHQTRLSISTIRWWTYYRSGLRNSCQVDCYVSKVAATSLPFVLSLWNHQKWIRNGRISGGTCIIRLPILTPSRCTYSCWTLKFLLGRLVMFPCAVRSLTSGFTQITLTHNAHLSQSKSKGNREQISLYSIMIGPLLPEMWLLTLGFSLTSNWVRSCELNDTPTSSK